MCISSEETYAREEVYISTGEMSFSIWRPPDIHISGGRQIEKEMLFQCGRCTSNIHVHLIP